MADIKLRAPYLPGPDLIAQKDEQEHDVWARSPYAPGPDLIAYGRGPVADVFGEEGLPDRTGTLAGDQPAQTGAIVGDVDVVATSATTAPAQTGASAATVLVTATSATSSPAQTGIAAVAVLVSATSATSSPAQTGASVGTVRVSATSAGSSPAQTGSVAGDVDIVVTCAASSPAQTSASVATVSVTATSATSSPAQTGSGEVDVVVVVSSSASSPAQTGSGTVTVGDAADRTGTLEGENPAQIGSIAGAVTGGAVAPPVEVGSGGGGGFVPIVDLIVRPRRKPTPKPLAPIAAASHSAGPSQNGLASVEVAEAPGQLTSVREAIVVSHGPSQSGTATGTIQHPAIAGIISGSSPSQSSRIGGSALPQVILESTGPSQSGGVAVLVHRARSTVDTRLAGRAFDREGTRQRIRDRMKRAA